MDTETPHQKEGSASALRGIRWNFNNQQRLTCDLAVRRKAATSPSSVLFSWEKGESWEDGAKGKKAVMIGPRSTL